MHREKVPIGRDKSSVMFHHLLLGVTLAVRCVDCSVMKSAGDNQRISLTVMENSSVVLPCVAADGTDKLARAWWQRTAKDSEEAGAQYVHIGTWTGTTISINLVPKWRTRLGVLVGMRNFSLVMHHVAAEDAGMYECKIRMESGKENITSKFWVNIRTGQDDSKYSNSNQTTSSTCSTVSASTNLTKMNDHQFYFIPFLCISGIMAFFFFFCIYLLVKIIQLQRDSKERSKPQDDTDQTDPLSPKPTEPTYVTAETSEVVENPYSSLNPICPELPTRPVLPSARNKSQWL